MRAAGVAFESYPHRYPHLIESKFEPCPELARETPHGRYGGYPRTGMRRLPRPPLPGGGSRYPVTRCRCGRQCRRACRTIPPSPPSQGPQRAIHTRRRGALPARRMRTMGPPARPAPRLRSNAPTVGPARRHRQHTAACDCGEIGPCRQTAPGLVGRGTDAGRTGAYGVGSALRARDAYRYTSASKGRAGCSRGGRRVGTRSAKSGGLDRPGRGALDNPGAMLYCS